MFFKRKNESRPGKKRVTKVVHKESSVARKYIDEKGHTCIQLREPPTRHEYHGEVTFTPEEEEAFQKRINWILGEEPEEPKKPKPPVPEEPDIELFLVLAPEDEEKVKKDLNELRRLELKPYSSDINWRGCVADRKSCNAFPRTAAGGRRHLDANEWIRNHGDFTYDLDLLALKIYYGYYKKGTVITKRVVQRMLDAHSLKTEFSTEEILSSWEEQVHWRPYQDLPRRF